MTDNTTVSVSKETRDELKELREYPKESLESVIQRQINGSESDSRDENSEILEKLDRIEAMTQEATHAAQRVDTQLERME